ncbi:hypothetical protein GCM10027418_09780 [Mariniluteicoccus endophyticus]
MPDPRCILAKMEADVRAFDARAQRTQAALAASAVEATSDHLRVKLLGAHVVGIEFDDSALSLSAPQLTEEVRRTLLEGSARANHASADVVRNAFGDEQAARGVEDAAPEEVADERDRLRSDEELPAPSAEGLRAEAERAMTTDEIEDLLDDVLNRLDSDDESIDPAEIAREIGYEQYRSTVPPEQMQAQFEAEMDALKRRSAGLPTLVQQVEGTGANDEVEITVNAAGSVLATRFRAAFARKGSDHLAERFMDAYAAARSEAGRELTRRLTGSGLEVPDETRDALGL